MPKNGGLVQCVIGAYYVFQTLTFDYSGGVLPRAGDIPLRSIVPQVFETLGGITGIAGCMSLFSPLSSMPDQHHNVFLLSLLSILSVPVFPQPVVTLDKCNIGTYSHAPNSHALTHLFRCQDNSSTTSGFTPLLFRDGQHIVTAKCKDSSPLHPGDHFVFGSCHPQQHF